MSSADRHDSAIPMVLYDRKDIASNLHRIHSEFGTRKTDLFKRAIQEICVELPLKCNRIPAEYLHSLTH